MIAFFDAHQFFVMIRTKEDKHTVSCALSSDFQSQLALGVASSHRFVAVGKVIYKIWEYYNNTMTRINEPLMMRMLFKKAKKCDEKDKEVCYASVN